MSKKLRNRLIALSCMLAFIGAGVLFYVNWVVQRPFAIILFLTDNLTTATTTAARIYQNGADNRLALEKFPHLGLISTQAADFAVSDEAAAAAAVATGRKVNNHSLGVDASGRPLVNLFDMARERGRATGLVTNASLADPTTAAFIARSGSPDDKPGVIAQLVDSSGVDVILGGGETYFTPEHKEGSRKDGRDLVIEMRKKGYDIARNKTELAGTPIWQAPKFLGLFAPSNLAFAGDIENSGPQPSLAEMVRGAIQLLQYNRKGYLLVVDCGLVRQAASENRGETMLRELLALDDAVAAAVAFAGEHALILVAGKQSVGGLRLNGFPFRNDKGVALVGINTQGIPSLTWSTGPGSSTQPPGTAREPSAFPAPAALAIAEDGIVVGSGPGSEAVRGFMDNTQLFHLIAESL